MVKYFCCIDECSNHKNSKFKGWTSLASLQTHLNKHLNKTLDGDIPESILKKYKWLICDVCHLLTSAKHPTHKVCQSKRRNNEEDSNSDSNSDTDKDTSESDTEDTLPSIEEICNTLVFTTSNIPKVARTTWAHTLANAISDVTYYNNMEKWQLFLMLPNAFYIKHEVGKKEKI